MRTLIFAAAVCALLWTDLAFANVTVTTPTNNSSFSINQQIHVYAYDHTSGVTSVQMYDNGSLKISVNGNTIDQHISYGQTGSHRLDFKSWINGNPSQLTTVNITITSGGTTTLAAEKANNTSANNNFTGSYHNYTHDGSDPINNGNLKPTNVSKVSVRNLLYSGSNTMVLAHLMPWFCTTGNPPYTRCGGHIDVGYDSADSNQVQKQMNDMISRGIQGVIIDWYGSGNTHSNDTALAWRNAAQANGHFKVVIMLDKGACQGQGESQSCVTTQLQYAYSHFETYSSYLKSSSGRPVVMFFLEYSTFSSTTWNTIKNNSGGNPEFVFENSGAFSESASDGGYAWIGLTSDPSNENLSYLDNFYSTALGWPNKLAFGSTHKGFDDRAASWSGDRKKYQHCGKMWLDSFAQIRNYYSSSRQLAYLQLPTWNDYEEGTELESGIDNCLNTVGLSINGSTITWSLHWSSGEGTESTIDHYRVYRSTDGTNLTEVTDVPAGTHSLNLSNYGMPSGSYKIFVKAVAKAMMKNVMSGSVNYSR